MIVIAVKIEGVGVSSGAAGDIEQFRFYQGNYTPDATQDPQGVYRRGLRLTPDSIGWYIDLKDWNVTVDGAVFEFLADAQFDLPEQLYSLHPLAGKFLTPLSSTATQIDIDDATLEDTVIHTSTREAIRLGTYAGSFSGKERYTSCTRAVLGTRATTHGVALSSDNAWFPGDQLYPWKDRDIALVRLTIDGSSTYVDEEILWSGIITSISAERPSVIQVECDSRLALLDEVKIGQDIWRGKLKPTPDLNQRRLILQYEDAIRGAHLEPQGTSDGIYTMSLSEKIAVKVDGNPRAISKRNVRVFDDGPFIEWEKARSDYRRIHQFYSTDRRYCGTGTGNTWDLPFSDNRLILTLQLLQTNRRGLGSQFNGDYDLGIKGMGADIHEDELDISSFEFLAQVFQHETVSLNIPFNGTGIRLKEFLQQELLRPINCMLVPARNGKLRVVAIEGVLGLGETPTEVVLSSFTGSAQPRQLRFDSSFDEVEVEYNDIPGFGPITDTFRDVISRARRRRDRTSQDFQMHGVRTAIGAGGVDSLLMPIIQRYHEDVPEYWAELKGSFDLYPGDIVNLTHPFIYQPHGGDKGITSTPVFIAGRRIDPPMIEYMLLDFAGIYEGRSYIGPACKVPSAQPSTATVTIALDTYASGQRAAPYDDDRGGFEIGDVIHVWDKHFNSVAAGFTIVSLPGNDQIEVDSARSWSAGEILTAEKHVSASAYQQSTWTYLADDNLVLSGGETGPEWITEVGRP
jgi:hypothetical protein